MVSIPCSCFCFMLRKWKLCHFSSKCIILAVYLYLYYWRIELSSRWGGGVSGAWCVSASDWVVEDSPSLTSLNHLYLYLYLYSLQFRIRSMPLSYWLIKKGSSISSCVYICLDFVFASHMYLIYTIYMPAHELGLFLNFLNNLCYLFTLCISTIASPAAK